MALTDRVDELSAAVAGIIERATRQTADLSDLAAAQGKMAVAFADLRHEVALLEQAVEKDKELQKSQTEKLALELRSELAIHKAETRVEIAALNSWKADQKKQEEEWARRRWAFGPNLVGAAVSVFLAALVSWLMTRRP